MEMNDQQVAVYRDALETEKVGYERLVETAKATGDDAKAKRYANRIQQVDDEIARVDALGSAEETVDDDESSSSKKRAAKS